MLSRQTHTALRYYNSFANRLVLPRGPNDHSFAVITRAHLHTTKSNVTTSPSTLSLHTSNHHPNGPPLLLPFHPFCTITKEKESVEQSIPSDSDHSTSSTKTNTSSPSKKSDVKPSDKFNFRDTLHTIRSGRIGGTEFKRLWEFTKPEGRWILGGIGCMAGAKEGLGLGELSIALSALFITGGVFNSMRVFAFTRVGHSVVRRIRHRLFDNITRQEIGFFDRTSTGELINRLSADTAIMGESMGGLQLSSLLRSSAQIVGSFSVMMYLSPDLTLVMTTILPVGMIASIAYGRFVRETQEKTQHALAKSTEFAEEKLLQIRTVRHFAKEEHERNTYFKRIDDVYDLAMLQTKGSAIFFGSTGAIGNVFLLGVLLYGAHLVQSGLITSGLLTSCLLYSVYIAMSAVGITSSFAGMMRGIGASSRVFELMDRDSLIPNSVGMDLLSHSKEAQRLFEGDIQFENVHFVYPTRSDAQILDGFDLSVPAGKAMAIVGESGSGKSTVFALLLRFYDVTEGHGAITIGGHDVKELKPDFIRNHIGVVAQEPVLFTGTIRENILYGLNEGDMKSDEEMEGEMLSVSREANAHDFIMDFPDGYDTEIGEGGINLSGGQKQRIAIARALIKKPSILLLDEATSALDAASEQLVADALEKSMKQRTTIVIAHRLSTIKNADVIAVLKDGRVAETGNHTELMEKDGSFYSDLVQRQLH